MSGSEIYDRVTSMLSKKGGKNGKISNKDKKWEMIQFN